MGCEKAHDKNDKDANQRFQVLASLMLSSQTQDPITWGAVKKLKEKGICNVEGIIKTGEKDIEDLIYPVGFYRRKAVYLKRVTQILKEKYGSDIPRSVKELCELPGVGPKMAHLCMKGAWNEVTGIGVDVHVHRISARLGWVPNKGIKSPEDTRKALESWLPFELWGEINHMLVGFGQTICTPLRPKCTECYNNVICPSSTVGMKKEPKREPKKKKPKAEAKKSTKRKVKVEEEEEPVVEIKEEPKVEIKEEVEEEPKRATRSRRAPRLRRAAEKEEPSEEMLSEVRIKIEP